MRPLEETPEGIRLRVKAIPRASSTEVVGIHADSLRIRLAAPPVDGAANDELVRFLADALAVPRAAICVVSGQTSRFKTVLVSGTSLERVRVGLDL